MTRVWFVAVCCDCEPQSPKPILFGKVTERDAWVFAHREFATGHRIELGLDIDES